MKAVLLLMSICFAAIYCDAQMIDSFNTFLTGSNQVLFVKTGSATSINGSMLFYERKNTHSRWKLQDSFPVVVGRSGLARDKVSSLPFITPLPVKKEGDGKSPAGIFPLGNVFSYHKLTHLRMPFKQVDTACYCVDDPSSSYYNTLIVNDTAKESFNSFEHMKRNDDAYEYGVWVLYNSSVVVPGNGSCIFIHVWKDDNTGTAGCTAMAEKNIVRLIEWLNKKKHPVLLQVVAEAKG